MSSLHRGAEGVIIIVTALTFSHGACVDTPYTGSACEEEADCTGYWQNLPGTSCIGGRCECKDPATHLCCDPGTETDPDCFMYCRPCSECPNGTAGCPIQPPCQPGDPGCPPQSCQADAECPGPVDSRCGTGRCVQGECTLEIEVGPLASQLRGDCVQVRCTAAGEGETVQDVGDYYDDGNQCTYDYCGPDGPRNEPVSDGFTCPDAGAGVCVGGECQQCEAVGWSQLCGQGLACDGKYCVPGHCMNFQPDPGLGETSEDCGGPCAPCNIGEACQIGADCESGVCATGSCKVPTCTDGIKNDAETGTDCGGASSCPLCPPGQACETGADCTSAVCWAGVCEEPSCFDGVRNDGEAQVDCGGLCEPCP